MPTNSLLHAATPSLTVIDPRGLPVRSVAYCRTTAGLPAQPRITRQSFDAAGRGVSLRDARLTAITSIANSVTTFSLTGQPLLIESVDAGWRLTLFGMAQEPLNQWDPLNQRQIEYDTSLRPVAIHEHATNGTPRVIERLTYAPASVEYVAHNQCAKLIRHDDPAGCLLINDYDLRGSALSESRRLLNDLLEPDWPHAIPEREQWLEGEAATTHWQFNATGEVLSQRDARANETLMAYNNAGQLRQVQLRRNNLPDKTVLSQILYNAYSQVERETAGNGVETLRRYEASSGRLLQLTLRSATRCFQDELYQYDPVGNLMLLEDAAQPEHYFKNQRTVPLNTYRYDTLYQLIEATGRESIPSNQGPGLPELHIPMPDPTRMAAYRQTFAYDAAGNMQSLTHTGNNGYTRTMSISPTSNRSLLKTDNSEPDFDASFDANGNLLLLSPGTQPLQWDTRNQLSTVIQVHREGAQNDEEYYRYDASGQRLRKVRTHWTNSGVNTHEVRYLPGLEVHYKNGVEEHHVIEVQTGNNSHVRVTHWPVDGPADIPDNQTRYGVSNHLSSSMLELDDAAALLTQEGYYAFGGTAWWAAKNQTQASCKTLRYSMKERDATGLYYYGLRYYAPWLQRWINPDPAGHADGLNAFRFNRNNPITFKDPDGAMPVNTTENESASAEETAEVESNNKQPVTYQYKHDKSDKDKFKKLESTLLPVQPNPLTHLIKALKSGLNGLLPEQKPKYVEFYGLKELFPGLYAGYEQRPNGGVRLNVGAHGKFGLFFDDKNAFFTAQMLAEELEYHGYTDYDSIRLVSCHSADSVAAGDKHGSKGEPAGQLMATLTGKPVKAFHGVVMSLNSLFSFMPEVIRLGIPLTPDDRVRVKRQSVLVKSPGLLRRIKFPELRNHTYSPETFKP